MRLSKLIMRALAGGLSAGDTPKGARPGDLARLKKKSKGKKGRRWREKPGDDILYPTDKTTEDLQPR